MEGPSRGVTEENQWIIHSSEEASRSQAGAGNTSLKYFFYFIELQ